MTREQVQKTIKVHILDKEYTIRSDEEEKVRQIADYLNEQIDRFRSGSTAQNRIDLSIMAAFQAASDYFTARQELERVLENVETRAAVLASRIEKNMSGTGF